MQMTLAQADAGTTQRPVHTHHAPPFPAIGDWQPTALLGEGTLTHVFQARPAGRKDLPAGYAVKVLKDEWQDDPKAVALIRREARVGSSVSHSHVVPVLAHSGHQRPCYLVMPLLMGKTLAARLASGFRPTVPEALWIARQVAEGLDGLATAGGVMHADVKPGNIFIAPDGHVTLIDLGYACPLEEHPSIGERPVVGTLRYLAPEAVTSALAADTRSDIYSLGITLYEMLRGAPAFAAEDPAELVVLQRQAVPRRLEESDPPVPPKVAHLVRKMLAKEPLRRPQTPRDLVDTLARLEIEFFAQRDDRRASNR